MESFACEVIKSNESYFLNIPFNVWARRKSKSGTVFAKVTILSDTINVLDFECRLIPKKEGKFYIPLGVKAFNIISKYKKLSVELEFIDQLKRINHNSPYSIENPIRRKIEYVGQPSKGLCMHAIVSMLTGINIEEACDRMQARAFQGSISKMLETLDYYGIRHGRLTYKFTELPKICIINTRQGRRNHFCLYYENKFYDPTYGIKNKIDIDDIISYIEIMLD